MAARGSGKDVRKHLQDDLDLSEAHLCLPAVRYRSRLARGVKRAK